MDDGLPRELKRVVERLRTLSSTRLATPLSGDNQWTIADAGHALAQQLADAGADLDGQPRRVVPRLHDYAVADQIAVTGRDVLAALTNHPDGDVRAVAVALTDLRRRLP